MRKNQFRYSRGVGVRKVHWGSHLKRLSKTAQASFLQALPNLEHCPSIFAHMEDVLPNAYLGSFHTSGMGELHLPLCFIIVLHYSGAGDCRG